MKPYAKEALTKRPTVQNDSVLTSPSPSPTQPTATPQIGLLQNARGSSMIPSVSPEIETLHQAGFHARDVLVKRILAEDDEQ